MEDILGRLVREDCEEVPFLWRQKEGRDLATWSLGTAYWAEGTAMTKVLGMND